MRSVAEIILGSRSGGECRPGDVVIADVDLVYLTDASAPAVIRTLKECGVTCPVDGQRIAIVMDHYVPCPNASVAHLHQTIREFAYATGCRLFEEGDGVCHQVLGEAGLINRNMLVVGADSHTVTYGAFGAFATGVGSTDAAVAMAFGRLWFRVPETLRLEITGRMPRGVRAKDVALTLNRLFGTSGARYKCVEIINHALGLSRDDLMTICNTAVEWGAKAAITVQDAPENLHATDIRLDLQRTEPVVAIPHSVSRVVSVREASGTPIQVGVIGTCSCGRFKDLLDAASILGRYPLNKAVRLLIVPASRAVYLKALKEGLVEVFMSRGAVMVPPSCGPCCGALNGIPGRGENVLSTSNRNFLGRMGNPEANVYLASALTVAASAVTGFITDPRELMPSSEV